MRPYLCRCCFLQVHPLAIELELLKETTGTQQQTLTTIKFTYLLNLNLVAAGCTDANDSPLLGALFPLDDGSTLPSEAQAQLENGTFQLDPSRPAKPYKCVGDGCGSRLQQQAFMYPVP